MPAVDLLLKRGWAVQLLHNPTEPAGQDHGFISIKDASGSVLVECQDFQHNRQDYYMPGWETQLAEVLSPVPDAPKDAQAESDLTCQVEIGDPDCVP